MTQGAVTSTMLAQQVAMERAKYDEGEAIPDPDGESEEYQARVVPRRGDKVFQVSAWVRDAHDPNLDRYGDPKKPEAIQQLKAIIQERMGHSVQLDVNFLQQRGKLIDFWAEKAKKRHRIPNLPGMNLYARPGDAMEAIQDYAELMIDRQAEIEPGVPFTKQCWSNKFDTSQNLSLVVIRAGG